VRDALGEFIDPALGVNIVNLGSSVASSSTGGRRSSPYAHLAACPLTGVLSIRSAPGSSRFGCVDDFRVYWQWIPAWRPGDITDSGREQLPQRLTI